MNAADSSTQGASLLGKALDFSHDSSNRLLRPEMFADSPLSASTEAPVHFLHRNTSDSFLFEKKSHYVIVTILKFHRTDRITLGHLVDKFINFESSSGQIFRTTFVQ